MPRASVFSVPRSGSPHPSALNHRLRRWLARERRRLRPAVATSTAACRGERYRKSFDAFAHASLLVFHGLSGLPSLRQSYGAFAACEGLVAVSGLGPPAAGAPPGALGVSFSQYAASNTSRPAAFVSGLLPALCARVSQLPPTPGAAPPGDLRVIDSTFVRVCLHHTWLPSRGGADVPGVRVQVPYTPAWDLPEHVLITDTRTPDGQGLEQTLLDDPARLAAWRGQTLAMDLGYYGHRRFVRLRAAQVHFVTRRHPQAHLTVEADQPVPVPLPACLPGRIRVLHDQRVTLGSPNNRRGAVLRGLRLVTATVTPQPRAARQGAPPVTYEVLTDRWDLPAAEVVQLYLWRWQIELFFRWLKRYVYLLHLLGYSRNAVELTVALALLVHLLTVLAAHALGANRRSPVLRARLGWVLGQLTPAELTPDAPTAWQLAFPGWALPLPLPP
jgi:hypothetical protein